MRALLTFEKYKITNVCGMRRYSRNIFQWNKNDIKSRKMTNGDYSIKSGFGMFLVFGCNWDCDCIVFYIYRNTNPGQAHQQSHQQEQRNLSPQRNKDGNPVTYLKTGHPETFENRTFWMSSFQCVKSHDLADNLKTGRS